MFASLLRRAPVRHRLRAAGTEGPHTKRASITSPRPWWRNAMARRSVAQHLREWVRFTIYVDAHGGALPSSVHAPEVQAYLAAAADSWEREPTPVLPCLGANPARNRRAGTRAPPRRHRAGAPRWAWGSSPRCAPIAWFSRGHRGLAERTIGKRARHLGQFAAFAAQAGVPTAAHLQPPPPFRRFFAQLAQAPATRLTYGVTLRGFLRWAFVEGRLALDLTAATIATRHHRHTGLRDVLSDDELTRLLTPVDRASSAIGRRDYAVVMLAARYGAAPLGHPAAPPRGRAVACGDHCPPAGQNGPRPGAAAPPGCAGRADRVSARRATGDAPPASSSSDTAPPSSPSTRPII